MAVQCSPSSEVRHNPPAGAQAHHSSVVPGRLTNLFNRPFPPNPVGPTGPAKVQLGSVMLRCADSWRRSSSARSRERAMAAFDGRMPMSSTRGCIKASQRWNGLAPLPRIVGEIPSPSYSAATESKGKVPWRMAALQCNTPLSCAWTWANIPKESPKNKAHPALWRRLSFEAECVGAWGILQWAFLAPKRGTGSIRTRQTERSKNDQEVCHIHAGNAVHI